MTNHLDMDTIIATALGWIDDETDAMAAPIRPSTSFLRDPENLGRRGRRYTRDDNPTYAQVEAVINALEVGGGARVFASGMAAMTALCMTLSPNDHVILPTQVYAGLRIWMYDHAQKWGLDFDFIEDFTPETVQATIKPGKTKIIWVETPSNPRWIISDIAELAKVAHTNKAILAIDNTVPTPIHTQPILHGADVVLHSGSKYLNGHGDLIAGACVVAPGRESILKQMETIRNDFGGLLGTFEAWLLLRGMRTLAVRMRTASQSALAIAEFLEGHPAVSNVAYAGLKSHPGHETALKQMSGGFGGMLSFQVKGGENIAKAVAANVRVIRRAISFGSVESVIEHRVGMEGPHSTTPRDLLRLSVGLESLNDLIDDLDRALQT